ncbi:TetR/AcrR family transcriptional regulator [Tuberibacillus sp. Marseille-P3662]|uniref:TetR/AcrR family transcriptional regulator n=1 Tax=Tuberibacillus sp. Marseille-P3662 TaxID=1965358 RepID=UPI000A1CE3C8|nr:TetR/AcrR family transcriptional regulator [Tuberibacillus sp. Marseille-P3662]
MTKINTRLKILDAASQIVHSDGIFDMTLDAVAEQADMSKGGLLYHFPSKEALIKGMVQHLSQNYIDNIKTDADHDQSDQGKWTRAFIKETYRQSASNQEMNAGLLAALAINPDLLEPMREAYKEWQNNIENDGLDTVNATILRLAGDGLWFSELFGLAPLNDDLRNRVLEALMNFTKEG